MNGSNIRETTPSKKVLYCDNDIGELKNKPEGTVTEEELKEVLRRYNLRDGLITIGKTSNFVFNGQGEGAINKAAYRDPETGVFVTQFALAYLAGALITSGSNDYRNKQISNQDNLLALCNIYSNGLIFPEIKRDESIHFTKRDLASMLVRMYGEQFEYQFDPVLLIARTIVIFTDVINQIDPKKFESLSIIFKRATGLSFQDYFYLVIAVWARSHRTATFKKEALTHVQISSMRAALTEEKVSSFLRMFSADYTTFREEDKKANVNLQPVFTKFRFNPLIVYPIITTDKLSIDTYIIPNSLTFIKRAFGGLYWWFHRYFETLGQWHDFRNYYGEVFEQYVGRVLKQIYGEQNVHSEINYPNGKFIDWWVERDSRIYLFEVKANQFALPTKQTGDIELLAKEVKVKIVKAIEQVYKRLEDVDRYQELSSLRGKKLVPVIIFLEIPLVSAHLYKELIDDELAILEESGLKGIRNRKIHFLNIEELELYESAMKKIPLEEVFIKYEDNMREGFLSIIQRELREPPRSKYLDNIYTNFRKQMTEEKYNLPP